MNSSKQRYIFTDFDNIQRVNLKKLEKVCDKIFILINSVDDLIPFELVRNLQKLGKAVKWIPVENNTNLTLNYHICYLIGKMHGKINKSIEFAILSDEDVFDPMIAYINSNRRNCQRVKLGESDRKKKYIPKPRKITPPPTPSPITVVEEESEISNQSSSLGERAKEEPKIQFVPFEQPKSYEVVYQQTKDRLKLVATRPYNLASLRDYIHINNQELVEGGTLSVEDVIEIMENKDEIEIRNGIVAYNF